MRGEGVSECVRYGRFGNAARRTASWTACWMTCSPRWCRRSIPLHGSMLRCAAGKTHCHDHEAFVFGYFAASALGIQTLPNPSAKSRSWSARTPSRCDRS